MSNIVLIIDDDILASKALSNSISKTNEKIDIKISDNRIDALEQCKINSPAVAIVDLSLDPAVGPKSGLDLIRDILKLDATIRIIVLTSHESSEYGVQALHKGAASFVEKPANIQHLSALIRDGITFCNLKRDFLSQDNINYKLGIKTKSKAMLSTLEAAEFAANNSRPILILGETGTGKTILAREIHNASKLKGKFIRFQPNFTNPDLIASELFGHERGAFTGANTERRGLIEEADQGTLFIDEVDELPKETQVSLLNVLQEKTFRRVGASKDRSSKFRLIAASNRSKTELTTYEKLRQDFFHRIAHGIIEIPALGNRKEDIADLAIFFLQKLSDSENLYVQGFTDHALASLTNYEWPGNIRELQAIVEGGVYRASYNNKILVDVEDLEINNQCICTQLSFREKIKEYELKLVLEALSQSDNNQSKAAELLQLDRTSLRRILFKK